MNHDELAHLDAAYVLGALEPEERELFEQHLASCGQCAQAVREVASLPRLLSTVDESVFTAEPESEPVPETLLPSLLREVRGRRRRQRRWALAAAAAVAVAAAGTAVAWTSWPDDQPVAVAPAGTPMQQVGQDVLRASLAMEEVPWGTRLELTCTYDAPASGYRDAPAPAYTLAIRTGTGDWEQVATWRAVPGRTVTVTGATAAGADDITSVEVRSATGRALLELDS